MSKDQVVESHQFVQFDLRIFSRFRTKTKSEAISKNHENQIEARILEDLQNCLQLVFFLFLQIELQQETVLVWILEKGWMSLNGWQVVALFWWLFNVLHFCITIILVV
jgi:hypothetical protein